MPEMKKKLFPLPGTDASSLWHNRAYLLVWGGTAISLMGTQASQLAFPLLVLALTNSAALAGLVGALRLLPYLFLSLPAGALLDRWDRKRGIVQYLL
jgi:MFS family permease